MKKITGSAIKTDSFATSEFHDILRSVRNKKVFVKHKGKSYGITDLVTDRGQAILLAEQGGDGIRSDYLLRELSSIQGQDIFVEIDGKLFPAKKFSGGNTVEASEKQSLVAQTLKGLARIAGYEISPFFIKSLDEDELPAQPDDEIVDVEYPEEGVTEEIEPFTGSDFKLFSKTKSLLTEDAIHWLEENLKGYALNQILKRDPEALRGWENDLINTGILEIPARFSKSGHTEVLHVYDK